MASHLTNVARTSDGRRPRYFLLATTSLVPLLRAQFGDLVYNHRADDPDSLVGPMRDDASFPSEESAEYTADMCDRIAAAADAWIVSHPKQACAAAAVTDPLEDWNSFYTNHDGSPPVANLFYVSFRDRLRASTAQQQHRA